MTALRHALFIQFSIGIFSRKDELHENLTNFRGIYILQYIQHLSTMIFMPGHSMFSYSPEEGLGANSFIFLKFETKIEGNYHKSVAYFCFSIVFISICFQK